jgi:hypothetical protein
VVRIILFSLNVRYKCEIFNKQMGVNPFKDKYANIIANMFSSMILQTVKKPDSKNYPGIWIIVLRHPKSLSSIGT